MAEVFVTVAGLTQSGKSAVAHEIAIALRAIGLTVAYDPDPMYGADHFEDALRMHNPAVTIIEENWPRSESTHGA